MPEGCVCDQRAEHYKAVSERLLAESTHYQALLYHAWATITGQQKGLKRQAKRIRRLQLALKETESAPEGKGAKASIAQGLDNAGRNA